MLELTENLESFSSAQIMEYPSLQRIQKMTSIFEEMIETMVVLYRCIDDFEEAVEYYNDVKILLTNINISVTEEGLERDYSEDNDAASLISMDSAGYITRRKKEKVTKYVQITGDIMWEQGEFKRTMKFYS